MPSFFPPFLLERDKFYHRAFFLLLFIFVLNSCLKKRVYSIKWRIKRERKNSCKQTGIWKARSLQKQYLLSIIQISKKGLEEKKKKETEHTSRKNSLSWHSYNAWKTSRTPPCSCSCPSNFSNTIRKILARQKSDRLCTKSG